MSEERSRRPKDKPGGEQKRRLSARSLRTFVVVTLIYLVNVFWLRQHTEAFALVTAAMLGYGLYMWLRTP